MKKFRPAFCVPIVHFQVPSGASVDRHTVICRVSTDPERSWNWRNSPVAFSGPENLKFLSPTVATDRRGYVLEHRFTKFSEITQFNGHYAVQGHSKSQILVPIESSYTTSY